ncbi:response regulator [bacterium]|nr:response regulator [bacterium]
MKILLVEDDERVRKILRIHLTKAGHELIEAENGQVGWDMFSVDQFDFILCDIRMPRINGIELVKKIRETSKDIPIIILSGFMDSTMVEEAMSAGANDFLSKPVKKSELLEQIEHCLNN